MQTAQIGAAYRTSFQVIPAVQPLPSMGQANMGKVLDGFTALLSKRRTPNPEAGRRSFLVFSMGGKAFGLDVRNVQEIRRCERLEPVANAPAFVLGMLDIRGTKTPVVDIRPEPRTSATEGTPEAVVILVKTESLLMGMVADSVSDVISISPSHILPPEEAAGGPGFPGIAGLADVGNGTIVLIDFDKLISAVA